MNSFLIGKHSRANLLYCITNIVDDRDTGEMKEYISYFEFIITRFPCGNQNNHHNVTILHTCTWLLACKLVLVMTIAKTLCLMLNGTQSFRSSVILLLPLFINQYTQEIHFNTQLCNSSSYGHTKKGIVG